jgi:hypothetical protein
MSSDLALCRRDRGDKTSGRRDGARPPGTATESASVPVIRPPQSANGEMVTKNRGIKVFGLVCQTRTPPESEKGGVSGTLTDVGRRALGGLLLPIYSRRQLLANATTAASRVAA